MGGGALERNANEVERVGMTLPHHFGRHIKRQEIKKLEYVVASVAYRQMKIHDNQLKIVSMMEGGI
jgi:hypothetical protein